MMVNMGKTTAAVNTNQQPGGILETMKYGHSFVTPVDLVDDAEGGTG